MSFHVSNAFASEVSALFRSAGRSWTTPPEYLFFVQSFAHKCIAECEMTRRPPTRHDSSKDSALGVSHM